MKIALISGGEADFNLQRPDAFPSSYFFSIERSGSSLFWYLVTDLLAKAKRSYCEPLEDLFVQGITREQVDTDALRQLLARPGYAFGMFRSLDEAIQGINLAQNKKFLLVRDPRDVLVSLYFSMAGSHRVPPLGRAQEAILQLRELTKDSVRAFVHSQVAENVHVRYRQYRHFCEQQSNVTIFRYEDVIFDKLGWTRRLIGDLDLTITDRFVRKVVERHDLLPSDEQPLENVRQVCPGNWRKHLDDESAARIEKLFAVEMAFFGYVPEVSVPEGFSESLPLFCKAMTDRLVNAEARALRDARERQQARRKLHRRIMRRFGI